ncbi:sensor histidine kinase [Paraburkholderia sp.]|uniref:sensor histidine kinase n=1 Tax=Paraburkholderia sp. TaxID=1926495 RepID=UPI003D6F9335
MDHERIKEAAREVNGTIRAAVDRLDGMHAASAQRTPLTNPSRRPAPAASDLTTTDMTTSPSPNDPDPRDDDTSMHVLQMREVHHRVRNSLNLISCTLQLQARQSGSEEVRRALTLAVERIDSLARIHGHLYGHDAPHERDAVPYLENLVRDLQAALLSPHDERRLELLSTEPFSVRDDALMSIGSIVTELVTNAIKYGTGDIAVSARRTPEQVTIVVEDGGRGFPADFDATVDAGFGLRLVNHLCARSAGAMTIDRAAGRGRVVACLGLRG